MAITREILRTYRAPRAVMRRALAAGQREDRAIAYLIGACVVNFIAQWPRLQREATLNPDSPPLDALLGGALMGWVFLAPIFFYILAALSHAVARLFGGKGSWWSGRLALFWSLLATTPLMLLNGLVAGFLGPGAAHNTTGGLTALAFLLIWGLSLLEAERPQTTSEPAREA